MDAAQTWIPNFDRATTHFPVENIPFGCFHAPEGKVHCCTRVGDYILDLAHLFEHFKGPKFSTLKENVFAQENLNKFAALGKDFRLEARQTIQNLVNSPKPDGAEKFLHHVDSVKMTMPVFIRDYTDFYSSKNHATNIGVMFRGKDNALQPNWLHLPVGYHGRASSIVVDQTPITRPKG